MTVNKGDEVWAVKGHFFDYNDEWYYESEATVVLGLYVDEESAKAAIPQLASLHFDDVWNSLDSYFYDETFQNLGRQFPDDYEEQQEVLQEPGTKDLIIEVLSKNLHVRKYVVK